MTFCRVRWVVLLAGLGQLAAVPASPGAESTRGVIVSPATGGEALPFYESSHALLIGVSDYTAGWPNLETVPAETARVAEALDALGFQVVQRLNPDARELRRAFQEFIDDYGYQRESRLLVYFSGHGHSWDDKGYLVPADSPLPATQTGFPGEEFLRMALPMSQIVAWGRQMAAKHVLFLFDSCFSGTVFKTKGLPERPPHLSRLAVEPVRQYITAGSAGEEVPAKSIFTQALVDALGSDLADLYRDGYLTGTELGVYLQGVVSQYGQQTPQYGKGPDYEFARGEFVFTLRPRGAVPSEVAPPEASATPKAGDQAFARWRGSACLYAGRVIEQEIDRRLVRYQFGAEEWVAVKQLVDPVSPRPDQVGLGSRVYVRLNSKQERWVPGRIVDKRGDKFLVDLARDAACRENVYHAWAFATDLMLR